MAASPASVDNPTGHPAERMSTGARAVAVIVCWLLIVFDGYDLIVYGTVKPSLIEEWGLSQGTAGTLGSAAFLGMMIGAVTAGRLSDGLGRRTTVLLCTLVFSVATVACAFAHDPVTFGILRLIAGLGLGGLVPSANALAADLVTVRWRSTMATLMMSGVPIGGSLAALTGIPVIPADWFDIAGWRWMFVFPVIALIVLMPLAAAYIPKSLNRPEQHAIPGTPAVGHAKQGFGALLRPPYLTMSILFAVATLATLFAWYGLGTELPNLMKLQGAQLGGALVFALVLNLGAVLGSIVTAWAGDRFGPIATGMVAAALAAVGLFVIMVTPPSNVFLIYVMLVLAGVGTHGTQCVIIGAITLYYPNQIRGTALGWALGVGRIGAVLAPQTAGLILGSYANPADGVYPVFMVFAGAALVSAILLLVLLPVIRRVTARPASRAA